MRWPVNFLRLLMSLKSARSEMPGSLLHITEKFLVCLARTNKLKSKLRATKAPVVVDT